MSPRPRHPLKSFIMFVVVCGIGGLAWANRDRLKTGGEAEIPSADLVDSLRDTILDRYEREECFVSLRTSVLWRSNERRFRLDIVVAEGCTRQAKSLTADIARLILRTSGKPATVFAYDAGNTVIAKHVL